MKRTRLFLISIFIALTISATSFIRPQAQAENPNPPGTPVRLIFIHHSTGENWLNDDNGGLARALQENNYFPSDTNYGWGQDAIGDRTDIPNWTEWFRGANTEQIMQAVFSEAEVHSLFTRSIANPGGENQIVLIKSCFPNSALEGSPNDGSTPGSDLTVGNAKYTYNKILQYFKTRPDKLFVVITAPPLTDPSLSANARAFNQWLVNDWLRENNYTLSNVAVFDFYNILTSPNNHHRFTNGAIEHIIKENRNTEFYPSEDDHPSRQGNQKATQEFLPMLNIFFNRWKDSVPTQANPQLQNNHPTAEIAQNEQSSPEVAAGSVLFDFESDQSSWEGSADEAVKSTIICLPDSSGAASGSRRLRMELNVLANSWATCSSFFDAPRDLSSSKGVQFMLHVEKPGNILHMDIFTGPDGDRATYAKELTYPDASSKWISVQIKWDDFKRVEWEANGGTVFNHPEQITGLAFGFPAGEEGNKGIIRVDDIKTYSNGSTAEKPVQAQPTVKGQQVEGNEQPAQEKQPPEAKTESRRLFPFCGSIALVPFGLLIAGGLKKARSKQF